MENTTNILDAEFQTSSEPYQVSNHIASATKRFFNFVIDYAFVLLLFVCLGIIMGISGNSFLDDLAGNPILDRIFTITVYIIYATVMESTTGKTIGKFITKTKVVDLEGNRPGIIKLLGRNAARFIPFNQFSFFKANPVSWQDSLSDTRVVND